MPITLLRRGHEGPPLSTEITATESIRQDLRKRYSVVNISGVPFFCPICAPAGVKTLDSTGRKIAFYLPS